MRTDKAKLEAISRLVYFAEPGDPTVLPRIQEIICEKPMKLGLCSAPIMEKQACCKSSCDGCEYSH